MCKYAIRAICISRIAGMPYLNFLCIVLGCQTFIPIHAPMLPPSTASNKKRGFRNTPLGFLRLVFVNAIHDECNNIDGKEIVGEATHFPSDSSWLYLRQTL